MKKLEDSDSKVVIKQILAFTLTEKGAFVREILVQELAKGLDALWLGTLDSVSTAANLPFGSSVSISSMRDEDMINLRNLYRLLHLLTGIQKDERALVEAKGGRPPYMNQRTYSDEVALAVHQFPSVQDVLTLLSIIPELTPNLQQQLLLLPTDLAGKLVSRIVARTLRRAFL